MMSPVTFTLITCGIFLVAFMLGYWSGYTQRGINDKRGQR